MSTIKWCCHPTRHQGDRRMGPDGPDKYRKGKNRISPELACSIKDAYSLYGSTQVIDTTSDLLCTACFNFETSRMDSVKSSHKVDTKEATRSTARAAAVLASARISDQIGIEHMVLDQQERHYSSDDMDDETPQMETAERRAETISPQVIHPSPEPAGMTSFLAVSLSLDSCPEKTGELLLVPIGSRKVRLETDWKITGIVRKHPTGIRRQRTSQKRLGNGRKRRKPARSDTEIAETDRLF